jgi:GTPase SAR1 family protein
MDGALHKVRVLLVGDSGTGKSTWLRRMVRNICDQSSTSPTLGCALEVMLHKRGFAVEFVDVSGDYRYAMSRQVMYTQINAVMMFFDATNPASFNNLKKWIKELVCANRDSGITELYSLTGKSRRNQDEKDLLLGNIPVICVGTKCLEAESSAIAENDSLNRYGIEKIMIVS